MRDTWRSEVASTLTHLVRDLSTSPQFDLGLLATGVLWPIRTRIRKDESAAQADLRPLVGDDAGMLCTLVRTWPEDIHQAAAITTQTAAASPTLKAALQHLVTAADAAPLLSTTLIQQYATAPGAVFHGNITAALLNVGGTISIGTLTIQLPDDPTARTKRHLDEATALLPRSQSTRDCRSPPQPRSPRQTA